VVDIRVNNGKAMLEKPTPSLAPTLDEMVAQMERLGWENEPEAVDWGFDVGSERIRYDG
jgi:antitoxin MazE